MMYIYIYVLYIHSVVRRDGGAAALGRAARQDRPKTKRNVVDDEMITSTTTIY